MDSDYLLTVPGVESSPNFSVRKQSEMLATKGQSGPFYEAVSREASPPFSSKALPMMPSKSQLRSAI